MDDFLMATLTYVAGSYDADAGVIEARLKEYGVATGKATRMEKCGVEIDDAIAAPTTIDAAMASLGYIRR